MEHRDSSPTTCSCYAFYPGDCYTEVLFGWLSYFSVIDSAFYSSCYESHAEVCGGVTIYTKGAVLRMTPEVSCAGVIVATCSPRVLVAA